MNVLVVQPDPRTRDVLAEYLRTRGHRARSAGGVDEALRALRTERFDTVVTAWQLGDDDASAIVASAHGPCIVTSASTRGVVEHPAVVAVLTGPVEPARVAAVLSDATGDRAGVRRCDAPELGGLPVDTRERVQLVLSMLDAPDRGRVDDDGVFITIEGALRDPEGTSALLEGVGGDLRVLATGDEDAPLRLLLRLDRRGRPAGVECAVAPDEPWPAAGPFAIDCHGATLRPNRFLALCDRVARAARGGREIHVVNVPPHLRLCLEAVGRADDLPMRRPTGPRLPEILGERWR